MTNLPQPSPEHQPYIWDAWYRYDKEQALFHVYYLNVDDHGLPPLEQHHFCSRIGYATTTDFDEWHFINHSVLSATDVEDSRDNTSLWTGSQVVYGQDKTIFMAFTSRDMQSACVLGKPQPFTQHISFARSSDGEHWERIKGAHLDADARFYQVDSIVNDVTIHAWRDPFIFRIDGSDDAFMLLTVQAKELVHGVKGVSNGAHGSIALLRTAKPYDLLSWEATGVTFSVSVAEAEVPRVYYDEEAGKHIICYSYKNDDAYVFEGDLVDHAKVEYGFNGFHVDFAEILALLAVKAPDHHHIIDVTPDMRVPLIALGDDSLYACQVIPELGGMVLGFDPKTGVLRKSEHIMFPSFKALESDFSAFHAGEM